MIYDLVATARIFAQVEPACGLALAHIFNTATYVCVNNSSYVRYLCVVCLICTYMFAVCDLYGLYDLDTVLLMGYARSTADGAHAFST